MFGLNFLLKFIIQKVFRETNLNRFGVEDPYYEKIQVEQNSYFSENKFKTVKIKRRIPTGLSTNDEQILKKVIRRAYHLDMLFNFFGYRIGWSGIVSFIPLVGDVFGIFFSVLLFLEARKVDGGLPLEVQGKFILNIAIDFLLGIIPIVGSFVEVVYKANSRNALILEKYLENKSLKKIGESRKKL